MLNKLAFFEHSNIITLIKNINQNDCHRFSVSVLKNRFGNIFDQSINFASLNKSKLVQNASQGLMKPLKKPNNFEGLKTELKTHDAHQQLPFPLPAKSYIKQNTSLGPEMVGFLRFMELNPHLKVYALDIEFLKLSNIPIKSYKL